MKNPHPLNSTWNRSNDKEPVMIPMPGTNKKFKRKSREPKRLCSSPEPDKMKTFSTDISDMDSVDDTQAVNRLAPQQRKLTSQEAHSAGILSGVPEGKVAPSQSGAIDMRIGSTMPAITSKLCKLPGPPFSNVEIAHWPTAISQPLSNRLKLGPCSTFPLSTSSSSSHSHQTFSLEPSLSGQVAPLPVPRASHTPQCHEHVELQVHSPKVCGMSQRRKKNCF